MWRFKARSLGLGAALIRYGESQGGKTHGQDDAEAGDDGKRPVRVRAVQGGKDYGRDDGKTDGRADALAGLEDSARRSSVGLRDMCQGERLVRGDDRALPCLLYTSDAADE